MPAIYGVLSDRQPDHLAVAQHPHFFAVVRVANSAVIGARFDALVGKLLMGAQLLLPPPQSPDLIH